MSLPPSSVPDDIRVMTPEEVQAEESIFAQNGAKLPNPAESVFIGAFRGGKRVAFLVLQAKLHAEPLFIEEGHSAVMPALVKAAERYILQKVGPQWVYLFAPAGRIAQMATAMGLQMEPWVVMSKLVQPELPAKAAVDLSLPSIQPETEAVQ